MKLTKVWQVGMLCGVLNGAALASAGQWVDEVQSLISQQAYAQAESVLALGKLSDFQQSYFEGLLALERSDKVRALSVWQNLHERYPEQLILGNNLAVLLMQQGEIDSAQRVLERSLQANRDIANALENLKKIYSYHAQQHYRHVFKRIEAKKPVGTLLALTEQNAKVEVIESVFEGQELLMQALSQWQKAWSDKNVKGYFAMYHDDFVPANNQALNAWRNARTRSLQAPRFIEIALSEVKLMPIDQATVRIQFHQAYRSDRFEDKVTKVLLFKKQANDWKIIQEMVLDEM